MTNYIGSLQPTYLFEDQSPLYRSPRPSNNADTAANLVASEHFTDVIVLLEGEQGRRFSEAYKKAGLSSRHFPIEDYGTPTDEELKEWIPQIVNLVKTKDHKTLMHCYGGIGRTGSIAACVLAALRKINGDQAIDFIRARIPGAIDSDNQEAYVRKFALSETARTL